MNARLPTLLVVIVSATAACAVAAEPAPTAAPARADVPPIVADFDAKVRPLLQRYCYQCHGPDSEEAGVTFADIKDGSSALRLRAVWRRSAKQVASRDMPPEDTKRQPTDAERKLLVDWMKSAVDFLDCSPQSRDPGPALVRRLNRTEYDNTLRDLLGGVPFDSGREVGMPADEVVDGFDNTAAALTLSPAQFEKYLAAADKAIEKVFGPDTGAAPTLPPPAGGKQGGNAARPKPGTGGKGAAKSPVDAIIFVRPGDGVAPRDAARQVVTRLVCRAYRRPAQPAEVDRLLALFDDATAAGKPFDAAIRATVKPVLISPHFLFRVERTRPAIPGQGLGAKVDDHELATRLSYFLWSTMPDDELAALADAGRLSDPATLAAQVKRMLADPRARALTENFAAQWLQLRKLATARPSTEFFPTFNGKLRQAMYDETATFFDKLREEDRPVTDLLDADYTYVNADLAKHYGIAGVTGSEIRKVALKPEHRRGGLLGMGSVLALTSHTSRTSPTQRGKYVLEVIFGTPPPPPPPNVSQIDEAKQKKDKKGPDTFRAALAAHATQKSCAGCHAKIDPIGFALDNYDAVGAWRDATPDNPLDVTGTLPTGESLNGAADLKRVILGRQDDFARNAAEQMLSYALGRKTDYYDECALRELTAQLKADGYRFSALVAGVVNGYAFQHRRGGDAAH